MESSRKTELANMHKQAVIIGGGVVGASVALALVRKGWGVTVIEKEETVGRGSTARSSSVVRCHYTRPEGIALAHEGQLTWAGGNLQSSLLPNPPIGKPVFYSFSKVRVREALLQNPWE